MGTQRSVQALVRQSPGLITQIVVAHLQTAVVRPLFRVFLNCSYQLALQSVPSNYQLTDYSLLLFN